MKHTIIYHNIRLTKLRIPISYNSIIARYYSMKSHDNLDTTSFKLLDNLSKQNIESKTKIKLSKGLEPVEKKELSVRASGASEALCSEINDSIVDCLTTDKLFKLFHGFNDPSDVVEIMDIEANLDFSHVTILWRCAGLIQQSIHVMEKNFDEVTYKRISSRIINGINNKLQLKEPIFRSHLMKQVYFKKVPRLFFRNYDEVQLKQIKKFKLARLLSKNPYDDENYEDDVDE